MPVSAQECYASGSGRMPRPGCARPGCDVHFSYAIHGGALRQMTQETHDRSTRVLSALIREYIVTGEPVASALLATAAGLGVSSATVRNILARLEDEGYVQQPHTSAGRIPTDRGYRVYVDLLLEAKRSGRTAIAVEALLRRDRSGSQPDSLLSQASHVVSQASRLVAFALRPAQGTAVFDRVEFIPISSGRVLVVIVARGGHVLQKVIDVNEPIGADELHQAANYLNAEFCRSAPGACAGSGPRADRRGAAAVRRAVCARHAPRDVDVREPGR